MGDLVDVKAALRNVMQQLQEEPRRYKLFGVYWWAVKAMLKRAGYSPANLYMLGRYIDIGQAHDLAGGLRGVGHDEVLRRALDEYGHNAAFQHSSGMVENLEGELVPIFDQDAGI